MNRKRVLFVALVVLAGIILLYAGRVEPDASATVAGRTSNHFNGEVFFNPVVQGQSLPQGTEQRRGFSRWVWRWIFSDDWPRWPEAASFPAGPPPAARVSRGDLRVTPVGHATFLIQMDGINILTDPIWSERCSPVSWAGPRRYRAPGIRFDDLPSIDVVLVSHNHYDHLDLPTLKRLAGKGVPRTVTALGNGDLIRESGLTTVEVLDWWQTVRLSADITVTLVPAQHFSSRTLWDRNRTLWGGFVVTGPSGSVYFAGDTGYGPHFREIARRFGPIRMALLPIAPFNPQRAKEPSRTRFPNVHMGPDEAVQAHLDLGARVSIAAHFQVFQLGWDAFDEAPNGIVSTLKERNLDPASFILPAFGRAVSAPRETERASVTYREAS
ncbi:MAG: hypothetical protein HPY65_08240 [Syntrophaceae bacterium]|nr:hypothetical protein [Syntrophaceae bacterium]